ncbi:uncharacterized protein BDR25DRAFT_361110 [Lindgomyces ingoldianus]|uniref:Uncharacterized protein n=1 Tax=Lindgomyces ingoldianus TaxID=673940 RepID=A0ACB6QD34_9PLEO|nr:uncharacterized protein BDR25DRAFT_361110 [Lindgomyces ingoldianus]KAF2464878.1 hypothetical protein BDR25DRAFT_361110 [Lindgomyces ingoldianus]
MSNWCDTGILAPLLGVHAPSPNVLKSSPGVLVPSGSFSSQYTMIGAQQIGLGYNDRERLEASDRSQRGAMGLRIAKKIVEMKEVAVLAAPKRASIHAYPRTRSYKFGTWNMAAGATEDASGKSMRGSATMLYEQGARKLLTPTSKVEIAAKARQTSMHNRLCSDSITQSGKSPYCFTDMVAGLVQVVAGHDLLNEASLTVSQFTGDEERRRFEQEVHTKRTLHLCLARLVSYYKSARNWEPMLWQKIDGADRFRRASFCTTKLVSSRLREMLRTGWRRLPCVLFQPMVTILSNAIPKTER